MIARLQILNEIYKAVSMGVLHLSAFLRNPTINLE